MANYQPISGNSQTLEFATQWDLVQGTISNFNQSSETIYTLVHTQGQGSQALIINMPYHSGIRHILIILSGV